MCELYNSKETLFFPSNRFGPHPDFDYVYKNKQLKLKPVRSMDSPFYRPEDAYKWKINLTGKHKKDMHLKL